MKPFLTIAVSSLALSFCVAATSYSQSNTPPCSLESLELAKNEFRSALDEMSSDEWEISNKTWEAAIGHLENAANLCPIPPGPGPIMVRSDDLFVTAPYIPYYYLGTCHKELKDHLPVALRQFYLSSCFREPKRGGNQIKDLDSLTNQSLKQIVRQKRPEKQPSYFSDGVKAKGKDWEQSAERMWDSMQVWPEDGKTTIIDGRWPVPYVPRFHLANALFEVGCRQQACDQLARSKLRELAATDKTRKYDEELKEMGQLETKCAGARKGGPENMWICQQWQCWLQRDRQTP
jgi:hypothetical protein